MPSPDPSDRAPLPFDLRTVLMVVSVLLCAYAAWRLLNLATDIREQGMIPQLWQPLLSITAEVGLLLLCIGLLAARIAFVRWIGLAHAALWLVLFLTSLPVHVPLALSEKSVPIGNFSQAALSQKVLVFEFSMLVVTSLLAWGLVVYAARQSRCTG